MSRMPTPGGDNGDWGNILNDFLSQAHQDNGLLKDGSVTIDTIASNTVVDLTSDQTVDGVKTFTDSPVVPTPTTGTQAANKQYVDDNSGGIIAGNINGSSGTAIAIDGLINSGSGNTSANQEGSIAIGYDGNYAANADGTDSIAIGAGTSAQGNFALAFGSGSQVTGDSSTAIGWGAEATGEGATAIGSSTYSESGVTGAVAESDNSLAVGSSSASGVQSIAMGSSQTSGYQATSIGFNNTAYADGTTAMGSGNTVQGAYSAAFGNNCYIDNGSNYVVALGLGSQLSESVGCVAINGYANSSENSLAIMGNVYGSNGSIAIGTDSSGTQASISNTNDQIMLGTGAHDVFIPGTLNVQSTLNISGNTSGNDGDIWIAGGGLYFQANGTVYGPLT